MRIALLTNILTPYRIPVYHALARSPGLRWRFFTNAATEFDRSWRIDPGDLDVESVRSIAFRRRSSFARKAGGLLVTSYIPVGLLHALRRFAPDAVVSSELGARTLFALLYCRIFGVPLIIWSYHSRSSWAAAGFALRAFRRALLRRADALVGMGAQAREVLSACGVPAERIFDAPNAHDRDGVAAALAAANPSQLQRDLAEKHGCRQRIALVVGRLIRAKGIGPLLDAWHQLPPRVRMRWTLLFVGDGPLAAELRRATEACQPGEILRLPAVQPEDLPAYYSASQILLFPSLGDPWGLVVNEAFACSRPVVCSSLAGCADDLILPGKNGWITDPSVPGDLTATLLEALEHPDLRRLGVQARHSVERFSPERMAAGILRAVESACAQRRPHRRHAGRT